IRHYIDVDHWDVYPFEKVPRTYEEALFAYANIRLVSLQNDTIQASVRKVDDEYMLSAGDLIDISLSLRSIRKVMYDHVMFNISEGQWTFNASELPEFNKSANT